MQDVDEEREMWLNSFYRSPLRLPMPPELSYWWENGNIFFLFLNAFKLGVFSFHVGGKKK